MPKMKTPMKGEVRKGEVLQWQFTSILICPVPWRWECVRLPDTILWWHPSILCLFLLLPFLFSHDSVQHIFLHLHLSSILQMCPDNFSFLSMINAQYFFQCLAFILSLNSLFSAASVCGEFVCSTSISFKMPFSAILVLKFIFISFSFFLHQSF